MSDIAQIILASACAASMLIVVIGGFVVAWRRPNPDRSTTRQP